VRWGVPRGTVQRLACSLGLATLGSGVAETGVDGWPRGGGAMLRRLFGSAGSPEPLVRPVAAAAHPAAEASGEEEREEAQSGGMSTEDLLLLLEGGRSLAARLAFSKVLHGRLAGASASGAYDLPADVVEVILRYLYLYLEPVVVPHTSFAGAHTDNPNYFEYTDDALQLITVCWLSVGVTAERVPAGRYVVVLDLTADWQYRKHTLHTTVQTRQCPTGDVAEPAWEDCCAAYEWDPGQKGRGLLRICEVQLLHACDVRVTQQQLEGSWKGGTRWHRLLLEPLPVSAPALGASWRPEEAEVAAE
jgi:hypothetical protein